MRERAERFALLIDAFTALPEVTIGALVIVVLYAIGGFLTHWDTSYLALGGVVTGAPPLVVCFAIQSANAKNTAAIQSENAKNTAALQAKLDVVLHCLPNEEANRLIGLEKRTPEEIAAAAALVIDPDSNLMPHITEHS